MPRLGLKRLRQLTAYEYGGRLIRHGFTYDLPDQERRRIVRAFNAAPAAKPAAPKRTPAPVATAWPNNVGNYPGKRTPKPEPKVMTAAERFARLFSDYQLRAKPIRNPRPKQAA